MKLTWKELQRLSDEIVRTPGWGWLEGCICLPTPEGTVWQRLAVGWTTSDASIYISDDNPAAPDLATRLRPDLSKFATMGCATELARRWWRGMSGFEITAQETGNHEWFFQGVNYEGGMRHENNGWSEQGAIVEALQQIPHWKNVESDCLLESGV